MNAQTPSAHPLAHTFDLQHLPPLSAIAQRLLQEITRDDVDIPKLAAIIEQDPALTARLVGVANSAYFAAKEKVYTVADAIIRVLGLKLVRSLAIGIALSRPFNTHGCREFEVDRYWYCSMQTAALVSRLGVHLAAESQVRDLLFLAGLLHNLGQLTLIHVFPEQMCEILQAVRSDPLLSREQMQCQALGLNERQAAVALGQKWHLPYAILRIIEHQADPYYSGDHWQGARLVGYCSALANRCYDDPHVFDAIPSDAALASLALEPDTVLGVVREVASRDADMRTLAHSLAG